MQALIVIDQQKGIDDPKLGERNNPHAEIHILDILSFWRKEGWPIFHVRHKSKDLNSVFWPKQKGFEFKDQFIPLKNERIVEKSIPCAFVNNCLHRELQSMDASEIVIVGVATNNSVEASARTGGNLGYSVYVIENACFAFAKQDYFGVDRSAGEVHAMSLANIDGEYAKVISSEELFESFKAVSSV